MYRVVAARFSRTIPVLTPHTESCVPVAVGRNLERYPNIKYHGTR